jgi:hypothetical protein
MAANAQRAQGKIMMVKACHFVERVFGRWTRNWAPTLRPSPTESLV